MREPMGTLQDRIRDLVVAATMKAVLGGAHASNLERAKERYLERAKERYLGYVEEAIEEAGGVNAILGDARGLEVLERLHAEGGGVEDGIRIYSAGASTHTLVTNAKGEPLGPFDRIEILVDPKTNEVTAKLTAPVSHLDMKVPLASLRSAADALDSRTRDREKRAVEGTHEE
jgi:hypothetical protein